MLESMMVNPRPSRADVSDIANATYDRTTAVMLSGESAMGKHPDLCVATMDKISRSIEEDLNYWKRFSSLELDMSRDDSLYNIFTDEQKCVLLGNPYGNLYTTSEDGVVVRSPIDIAVDLYKETYGKDITIDEENGLDVVRGLREFLLTADIDQSVSEKSDDYVLDMYRNNQSRDVDSIIIDDKHDYLRAYMSEFAPDYGEDDYKKTL